MILVGKFGEQKGNKIQLLHSGGFTWVRFGVIPNINRNRLHAVQGLPIDGELQFLCFCMLRNQQSLDFGDYPPSEPSKALLKKWNGDSWLDY